MMQFTLYSHTFIEESSLIFITREGEFFTRVSCTTKLECTGVGDEVFWTFLGSTEPLIDSDTRFTNVIPKYNLCVPFTL